MRTFQQWLSESVTISVADINQSSSERIKDISSLCWHLKDKIYKIPGTNKHQNSEFIAEDGLDIQAQKGTINFYPLGLDSQVTSKVMAGIIYYLDELKVKHGEWRQDKSGLFKGETVYRIYVQNMPQQQKAQPPEVNMANTVAEIIFREILGMQININDARLSAREVLWKIRAITPMQIQQMVQEPTKEKNFIDAGISEDRIKRHLNSIEKIAQWALDNHYEEIDLS